MQIVDNLSEIAGPIISRERHARLADFDVVTIDVQSARPVAGKADLLSRFVGSQLPVAVSRDLLGSAQPPAYLRCRAKRTIDGAMCEKVPEPGTFSVAPSP